LSAHVGRESPDPQAGRDDGARPGRAPLKVLLADVEGPARRALAALLGGLEDVSLVGEVGARGDLAAALRRTRAEVLIVDDRLLRSGDHVLAGLGPRGSGVRVLVLGVDDDPAFAARARRLGAEAWVAKDRADDELPTLLTRRSHPR
jgi:DNA-binding NarL/FixJ family response regulator